MLKIYMTQRKENKNSICNFNSTVVIMLLFQVSDFGFKLAAPESSLLYENRKQVPGACGYMAPEYLMDGNHSHHFQDCIQNYVLLMSRDTFHAQKFDEDF